ncbi:MAG TPA: ABC transporter ATP-binding protein, partial [Tepidisphaeraceae bacterium]|nr:ABC transporter ATP-binding protein [Tepidisphaeraceae bacterium]
MSAHTMEEEIFTGKMDFALWKKMLPFAIPHKEKVFAVIALGIIVSGCDLVFAYLTGWIVNGVVTSQTNFHHYILAYIGVIIAFIACIFSFISIAGRLTVVISYDIRQTGFDKLQRLPFSFYDRKAVGWLMARMTSDCSTLSRVMGWAILDISWGTSALIGVVIVMLCLSWRLGLIVVTIAPVLMVISRFFQVRLLKTSRALRKANSQTTAAFNEGIVGVRTSKSMVRESRNAEEFSVLTGTMFTHAYRNAIYAALFFPLMLSVCSVGTALALRFGGIAVIEGYMKLGSLATFLQLMFFLQFPVQELTNAITQIQGAQAAAERVQSLLDADLEIQDSPQVIEKIVSHHSQATESIAIDGSDARIHSIEFRNITFAYKSGQTVLRDFNLRVQAGQSIALVGPTGGGKTTIVGLACRFYEPTSGQIFINGVDYRQRSLQWLQSNLGMVLQQPHLFSGTVRENIRYGRLNATDDEIVRAAKLTDAHDFIEAMKDGYNSTVGEGGNQLSTGQKQLIALARAIIANPQIFVMDEATSSVDTNTERAIQAAIDRILKNRISFVIAHRLSTIKSANRILVIDGGRIIEDGNHHQLIRNRGHYYDLYTNQFTHERENAMLEHAPV